MAQSSSGLSSENLGNMVRREAFLWGDNVAEDYFEPADRDMDRQWATVEPFLARTLIDYSHTLDLACGHGRNSVKLAERAAKITLADVNPENIAFCRRRFEQDQFRFVVNNGYDLKQISDRSITFVYCFEAAVHFDIEIILAYIKEFGRILVPGGVGFVHHSNYTKAPGQHFFTNLHGRNFMSKDIFAHLCIRNGLEIIEQKILDWGGPEADCFSLFRNTTGLLRPYVSPFLTSGEVESITSGGTGRSIEEKASNTIQVFERATLENISAPRYLLANSDLQCAFGQDESRALQHFREYHLTERRQQVSESFINSQRSKFARFKAILQENVATRFPTVFGRRFYSVELQRNETFVDNSGAWNAELERNLAGLYVEIGSGLLQSTRSNCLYVDVNLSLTVDVLVETASALPFKDASVDGIGCFTTAEKLDDAAKIFTEWHRILKPSGKLFLAPALAETLFAFVKTAPCYSRASNSDGRVFITIKTQEPNATAASSAL